MAQTASKWYCASSRSISRRLSTVRRGACSTSCRKAAATAVGCAASRSSRSGTGVPPLAPFSRAVFIRRSSAKASVCCRAPSGGAGGVWAPSHSSSRWTSCPWAISSAARRHPSRALALAGFSTRSRISKKRMGYCLSFKNLRQMRRQSLGARTVAHAATRMANGSLGLRPSCGSLSPAVMPMFSSPRWTR